MKFTDSEHAPIAIIAVISILAVIIFSVYFSVTNEPETFTEIWIEEIGEQQAGNIDFSFGIANHEDKEVEYQYTIVLNSELQSQQKVRVEEGNSRIIDEQISLTETQVPQRIQINVYNAETENSYSLWFWGNSE